MILDIEKIRKIAKGLREPYLYQLIGYMMESPPRKHQELILKQRSTQIKFQKKKNKRIPQGILRGNTTKWKGKRYRIIKKLKYNKSKNKYAGIRWGSEYEWKPLIHDNSSGFFDYDCKKYPHYLDIVIHVL